MPDNAFTEGGIDSAVPSRGTDAKNRSQEETQTSSAEEERSSSKPTSQSSGREEEKTASDEDNSGPAPITIERASDHPLARWQITYSVLNPFTVTSPASDTETSKIGYHISSGVKARLDQLDAMLKGREDVPDGKGTVVEAALELALREWEAQGDDSRLIQWLRRH